MPLQLEIGSQLLNLGYFTHCLWQVIFAKSSLSRIGGFDVRSAITERGLGQISDGDALARLAAEVLAANPQALADWKAGKQQALGFLVGQAMKASKGRGDAALLGSALRSLLDA